MRDQPSHGRGVRAYSAPIESLKRLTWNGGSAEAITRHTEGDVEFRFSSDRHAIYFTDHAVSTGETLFDGRPMNFDPIPHVGIYPAGGELRGWCTSDHSRYVAFFFEPGFLLRGIDAQFVSGVTLKPSRHEGDPLSWSLVRAIRDECEAGAPQGLLYTETAATMLSLYLLRHHSNLDQQRLQPSRGGLAPYQLKRVTDYIGDRLTDELSLGELADLVGLSAHHFCRVFKQSTGLPPHRWQIQQRVEKAKSLMLDTDLSLAEIAGSAGFSDQSHFTTVFRKAVGTTPHAWRRATRT